LASGYGLGFHKKGAAMNKRMLFIGGLVMSAVGVLHFFTIEETSFAAIGLGLFWISASLD